MKIGDWIFWLVIIPASVVGMLVVTFKYIGPRLTPVGILITIALALIGVFACLVQLRRMGASPFK